MLVIDWELSVQILSLKSFPLTLSPVGVVFFSLILYDWDSWPVNMVKNFHCVFRLYNSRIGLEVHVNSEFKGKRQRVHRCHFCFADYLFVCRSLIAFLRSGTCLCIWEIHLHRGFSSIIGGDRGYVEACHIVFDCISPKYPTQFLIWKIITVGAFQSISLRLKHWI